MKPLRIEVIGVLFVLVWSSGYVVGALVTRDVAPLAVTLWRFVVSALVLAALAGWRREHWPHGRELLRTAAIGVPMFAVQFGALYTALAKGMPAATTALIACSSPLLVAAVAAAARWERPSALNWLGICLGAIGVVVTLGDRLGRPPSLAALLWAMLGLTGLVAGTVLQSRLRSSAGPTSAAAVEVAVGALVLAVWAPLAGPVAIPLLPGVIGEFLWLGLVTGVGGALLMFALIRRRGATGGSSLLFLVPAVTALASWAILRSPIGGLAIIGLLITGAGLVLVRRRSGGQTRRGRLLPRQSVGSDPSRSADRRMSPGPPRPQAERDRVSGTR